jgi:hypothetical protein
MVKPYITRVRGTYAMLKQTLDVINQDHRRLRRLVGEADARAASPAFRSEPFPLDFRTTDEKTWIDFLGVEYDVVKSDLTGGDWVQYSNKPATLRIPWYNDVVPEETADLPEAYLIPPEWLTVIERLKLHGVQMRRLERPAKVRVRSCRFTNVRWEAERPWHALPYEGRHLCRFDLVPLDEERVYPAGTVVVDMNQRAARVAAHILEPMGPDAFVHWGFFNTIFQRVEYVESYVIEELAREMLAKDPLLKSAFEERKASDPSFAQDPQAIRDWFYRRTPYYDRKAFLYPVGMVDDRAVVDGLR